MQPIHNANALKTRPVNWTKEEDEILIQKTIEHNYKNWGAVASFIPGRTAIQCSARYKRIQPGLIKGAWTPEEDQELLRLYKYYGKNWSNISRSMPQRTGKQIRDRFLNALDDNLKKEKFSDDEDRKVLKWYKVYGNSWSKIAKKIKGRTGDMVKNRFYSSLKNHVDDVNESDVNNNNNSNGSNNGKEGEKTLKKKRRRKDRKDNNDKAGYDNSSNKRTKKAAPSKQITKINQHIDNNSNNTNNINSNNNYNVNDEYTNANNNNMNPKFIISLTPNNIYQPTPAPATTSTSIHSKPFVPSSSSSQQPPVLSPKSHKYFYSSNLMNQTIPSSVSYKPSQMIPHVNSASYSGMGNVDENDSYVISNRNINTSVLHFREFTKKVTDYIEQDSFQSKSEILKSLLQSQITNGVKKDNLEKQLEILKELKSITKERINAFSVNNS